MEESVFYNCIYRQLYQDLFMSNYEALCKEINKNSVKTKLDEHTELNLSSLHEGHE